MDLQQLRYVIALSKERHFQRAARSTHVSQPTLSQQVKKLEQELGCNLFERSQKGVRLTAEGEIFLPHALATLDNLEKGIDALQGSSGNISGTLRIAAIPTICPYLIPEVIPLLHKKAPDLTLEIYEETTSSLVEQLARGKFDIGVVALPIEENAIINQSISKEPFYIAISRKHPLAGRKKLRFQQIQQERLLILQEGHCFRDQALEYCEHFTRDYHVNFQGSSLTSVLKLAAAGEGVTFVPQMAVDKRLHPDLQFIPFAPPVPERELGLIWRISAPLNRSHHLFMETVRSVLTKKSSQ